jgi:hypothetical protein
MITSTTSIPNIRIILIRVIPAIVRIVPSIPTPMIPTPVIRMIPIGSIPAIIPTPMTIPTPMIIPTPIRIIPIVYIKWCINKIILIDINISKCSSS